MECPSFVVFHSKLQKVVRKLGSEPEPNCKPGPSSNVPDRPPAKNQPRDMNATQQRNQPRDMSATQQRNQQRAEPNSWKKTQFQNYSRNRNWNRSNGRKDVPDNGKASRDKGSEAARIPSSVSTPVPMVKVAPIPVAKAAPVPVAKAAPVPFAKAAPAPAIKAAPTTQVTPVPGFTIDVGDGDPVCVRFVVFADDDLNKADKYGYRPVEHVTDLNQFFKDAK